MKSLWEALPPTRRGAYAQSAAELAPQVASAMRAGDVVMVKGSNGSKAGAVAAALGALDLAGTGLMLYFLYNWLSQGGHEHVPVLNLLKYLTFRTGMSMLTAYVVAVAMGSRFIRWMKAKQGKGQPIRTDGIARHVTEKAGTPTMGGFMILAGLFVGSLLFADLRNVHVWVVLGITAAFGVLGFMDDYAKVTKQTTAGLSSGQKLIAQFIVSILAAVALIIFAPKSR
jgi:phospho-N-acetylmuramoyl-pentapeptide-transferase